MCRALTLLSHLGLALQSKGPVPHRQAVHNSDIPQRAVPWEHDSNACKSCWDVLTSPCHLLTSAPSHPHFTGSQHRPLWETACLACVRVVSLPTGT